MPSDVCGHFFFRCWCVLGLQQQQVINVIAEHVYCPHQSVTSTAKERRPQASGSTSERANDDQRKRKDENENQEEEELGREKTSRSWELGREKLSRS